MRSTSVRAGMATVNRPEPWMLPIQADRWSLGSIPAQKFNSLTDGRTDEEMAIARSAHERVVDCPNQQLIRHGRVSIDHDVRHISELHGSSTSSLQNIA